MPRVKLKQLDDYSFKTDITVRITDLNYGGHLGNDALLSLLHEARVLFLKQEWFALITVPVKEREYLKKCIINFIKTNKP